MIYAIIIHHNSDLDGYGSAVTAIEWLCKRFDNTFIHTIPINYNSYNIDDIVNKIETKTSNKKPDDKIFIFLLDFSLQFDELVKIEKLCNRLIWIDHHEQAQSIVDEFKNYIKTKNNKTKYTITFYPSYKNDPNRIGAAGLTYQTLFPDALTVPQILLAIAYHDVWRFSYKYIRPLISFIQILPWKNYYFLRKLIFEEKIDGLEQKGAELLNILCNFGKLLETFREKQIQSMMKYFSFGKFENYNVAVLNNTNSTLTSDLLNTILNIHNDLDFSISYFDNLRDNLRVFSLRSLNGDVNVGKIAKQVATKFEMNGGGHNTAAGFACPLQDGVELIKSLFKQKENVNDNIG
jgi:nanoRNase/pAp phosphatase (c-di-AMP/oligoRNAs hydrolase)